MIRLFCVLASVWFVVTGIPALINTFTDLRSALLASLCGLVVLAVVLARPRIHPLLFPLLFALAVFWGCALIWNAGELKRLRNVFQFLFFIDRTPWTPGHSIGAALGFAILTGLWRSWEVEPRRPQDEDIFLSGPQLISHQQALKIAASQISPADEPIFWAGLPLPRRCATEHFAIVGTPGSGKTLSLQLLMKSVLPSFRPGTQRRAVIYDAKRDTCSFIAGLFKDCPHLKPDVYLFNPFDLRGIPWAMNQDIREGPTASQIANILIEKPENATQPFFINAARALLGGVMEAFAYLTPDTWTLRDVILTMRHVDRIIAVLTMCPETRYMIDKYLTGSQRDSDVDATIETALRNLSFVAAAWHHSDRKPVSLSQWMKSESILILGSDPSFDATLQLLNRALFKRLVELIRKQPERHKGETRETWIIIDELINAGNLEDLDKVLVEGRSKGACGVIGFQDIPGLRKVFGDKRGDEIIGVCGNKVFLQNGEPATIEYATKHFKNQEILEVRVSQSHSESGGAQSTTNDGYSISRKRVLRPVVHDGLLKSLPQPLEGRYGLVGYCDTRAVGTEYPYRMELSPGYLDEHLPKHDPDEPNSVERPPEHYKLPEWTMADLQRLGLGDFPELLLATHEQRKSTTTGESRKDSKDDDHDIFSV